MKCGNRTVKDFASVPLVKRFGQSATDGAAVKESQRSAAPVLCEGPGRPVFPCPRANCEGMERRKAPPVGPRFARRGRVRRRRARLAALHLRRFLSPAPCFRARTRPSWTPDPEDFRPPSSAPRPAIQGSRSVVPADGLAGASRERACEAHPRAPPLPHFATPLEAPLMDRSTDYIPRILRLSIGGRN
jgi:hypothetical protein